jgi:signal transduction histidine kinase
MNTKGLLGLRGRVLLTLGLIVTITVGGGLAMIWYTYRMQALLTSVIQTDIAAFEAAKGLETALLNQRGYVSYYLLENNPEWLTELGRSRQEFDDRFAEARRIDQAQIHKELLDRIESAYVEYIVEKDQVIELYKKGQREAGAELHKEVRTHFFGILQLCEQHIAIHKRELDQTRERTRLQARRLRAVAGAAMTAAVLMGGLLSFMLVMQILEPIRVLASQAEERGGSGGDVGNEVATLKRSVHGLIENVDHAQMELERSRERLVQSEKLALVGKLAAEVAHSIRNPLTSIKMRLFSLDRTLDLTPTQREDFDVISDEMRHLDNIVRNFLEFSRPPKLHVQKVNVSDIVGMALQLLEKRLERDGIVVQRYTRPELTSIEADPELLKEVLVNLIVNACDAMDGGGRLTVTEEEAVADHVGRAVIVRLSDTGHGIPESIRDRVLQPFFSTKEEGTGLGLSIAVRIVEEHGGRLQVESEEGKGTSFTVILPIREEEA